MKRTQAGWIGILVFAVVGLTAVCAAAYTANERTVALGNWDTAVQWSQNAEPIAVGNGVGDHALVGCSVTNWGGLPLNALQPRATVTNNTTGNTCVFLHVGVGQDGPATGVVEMTHAGTFSTWYIEDYGRGAAGSKGTCNHTGSGENRIQWGSLYLGYDTDTEGIYNLSNASANVIIGNDDQWNIGAPELYIGYGAGGLGTFNHDKGSVYVTRHVYVGYETGSSATYDLRDGWLETGCYDARSTDGDLYVGRKGSGTLTQSGGYIFLDPPAGTKEGRLHVGGDGGDNTVNGVGVYNLSGGTCEVRSAVHIGSGGTGTVTQTGGRLKVLSGEYKHRMSIGQKNGKGVYNLYGGTLDLVRYGGYSLGLHVAGGWPDGNAIGELNIGNASGAGSLVETTAGDGMYLLVRQFDTDRATVRGWSDDGANRFQLTGILYNSGRIIADGYGTQRSLNLSTMSSVTNSSGVSDNTSSNGWFAQDKGKLILPGISVSEGNTYNWGEASDDASIDMVNSARITFNQLSAGPTTLTGSLLATDRSDVPAGPVSLISVHEFSLSGGATSSDFDITIRYDDAAAGTEEADLKLFHYAGGKWVDTEATLNAGNNWITATNLASFSQFGVGFDQAGGTMFKIR